MSQRVIDILMSVRGGELMRELDNALAAALEARQEHGGKAAVSMQLVIEGVTANDTSLVKVTGNVTKKVPGRSGITQVLFLDPERLLSTRDPRQPDLFGPRVITTGLSPTDAVPAPQHTGTEGGN